MYTKNKLTEDIRSLGVKPGDLLTVHTSLKSIGEIDPGERTPAHTFIDALRDCVPQGILMMPALTFKNIREEPVFNLRTTMPCIGAVPCTAVTLANEAVDRGDDCCIRSVQPSHSVVAFCKNAREFVEADRHTDTRTPLEGCFGKLYHMGGKILLVGVTLKACTFIHVADECFDPDPTGTFMDVTVTDYDGSTFVHRRRITRGPSGVTFPRYTDPIAAAGGITFGKVGDADAMLVDARICFDTVIAMRTKETKAAALG